VGGEGAFVFAGATDLIARFDDEGWSFVEVSWSIIVEWLFVVRSDALCSEAGCSGMVSSGIDNSGIRTESLLVDEVIFEFGSCCGGYSIVTSSKSMSEDICEFDTYSDSSPE